MAHLNGFGNADIRSDSLDVLQPIIAAEVGFATVDPVVRLDGFLAEILLVKVSVKRNE